MKEIAIKFAEVLVIRAVPGLLNLVALSILGEQLSTSNFGHYSTTVATATMIGSVITGPVVYGILPEFSKGRGREEQSYYVELVSGLALIFLVAGAAAMAAVPRFAAATLAVVAPAAMTWLQELLRGELRNRAYGIVAGAQAACFVIAIMIPNHQADASKALWFYAGSNLVGTIVAYALLGWPVPRFTGFSLLGRTVRVGSMYTGSVMLESGLTVGIRYLIMILGTPHLLGVFSFCLDVSQRIIGFLVSLSSFLFVPRAYKLAQEKNDAAFLGELRRGAFVGGASAIVALFIVLVARTVGLLPQHISVLLDPVIFIGTALAITLNRLKKISVDPVAMRYDRTYVIMLGYVIANPLTLAMVAAALWVGYDWSISLVLLGGYIFATVIAVFGYRNSFRNVVTVT